MTNYLNLREGKFPIKLETSINKTLHKGRSPTKEVSTSSSSSNLNDNLNIRNVSVGA